MYTYLLVAVVLLARCPFLRHPSSFVRAWDLHWQSVFVMSILVINFFSFSQNIEDIRNNRKTKVPSFDFENCTRNGFKELHVSEECGVVIFEGVYALHPEIRKSLDLWIAVVGGVHSHLISRVQRDKSRTGCPMSQNEIMMTVFPLFQQFIEPHLVHAHLKIRNDFDPVLSPESSLFVLKSNKQVRKGHFFFTSRCAIEAILIEIAYSNLR